MVGPGLDHMAPEPCCCYSQHYTDPCFITWLRYYFLLFNVFSYIHGGYWIYMSKNNLMQIKLREQNSFWCDQGNEWFLLSETKHNIFTITLWAVPLRKKRSISFYNIALNPGQVTNKVKKTLKKITPWKAVHKFSESFDITIKVDFLPF